MEGTCSQRTLIAAATGGTLLAGGAFWLWKRKSEEMAALEAKYQAQIEKEQKQLAEGSPLLPLRKVDLTRRHRLRDMRCFVLDNSLREPTVAASMGHNLSDKKKIFDCVCDLGFDHVVVGALNHSSQVDDIFCESVGAGAQSTAEAAGKKKPNTWSFSELVENAHNHTGGVPDWDVPVGLVKTKKYGIKNVVFEGDLSDKTLDWDGKFSVEQWVRGVEARCQWVHDNLGPESLTFMNIRDFPKAMIPHPDRVLAAVAGLAKLRRDIRPMGLLFEEPFGEYLPSEVGGWSALLRSTMDDNGWPSTFQTSPDERVDGVLVVHVHRQWGLADAVILDAFAGGCDGIMAAVCEEGAMLGHASTAVALTNLARLGNTHVTQTYSLSKLGAAARFVTQRTTGNPVAVRQPVYGPRAIEAVFGFANVGGGILDPEFSRGGGTGAPRVTLARLLGLEDAPIRLHSLATPAQFKKRLEQCFGEHENYPDRVGEMLKEEAEQQITSARSSSTCQVEGGVIYAKREYTSKVGLAMLYKEATGEMTQHMKEVVAQDLSDQASGVYAGLLMEADQVFRRWCGTDKSMIQDDDEASNVKISIQSFVANYVMPFFDGGHNHFDMSSGVDELVKTTVRKVFDLNNDGVIDLEEWKTFLVWALRSTDEEIHSINTLHSAVMRQAVLPHLLKGH